MKLTSLRTFTVAGEPITGKRLSEVRVRRSMSRILNDSVLCSIATVTPDRRAHINTAYFAYSDQLELYFLSHPDSLHCRNLASNASMAMTVFSSAQTWAGPDRGLQLFGTCRSARGRQARRAEQAYGRRFPAYARWKAALGRDAVARAYGFYRLSPARLKILDEREFGEGAFVVATVTGGHRRPFRPPSR